MRKIIIILLTLCSLFVSCASTSRVDNENKVYLKNVSQLYQHEIKLVENSKLRRQFDAFNNAYFNGYLKVDCIGTVKTSVLKNIDNSYNVGYSAGNYNQYDGKFVYIIAIDENYAYDKGILLHEMLHIYFYQTGNTFERHGENFIREAKKLEKLTGYPIHIIYPNNLSQ